jgi:hypothetical protein
MVINCTAEVETISQEIDVMVAAAGKYLGTQDLTSNELQDVLKGGVLTSQAVSSGLLMSLGGNCREVPGCMRFYC